ncbi:MAG: hypothetical protein JSU70_16155 [Phycisphaerales bacterium]|nr:MAG: hypothetical protein JSU70_16155 [Phycisphaerales bacterium]
MPKWRRRLLVIAAVVITCLLLGACLFLFWLWDPLHEPAAWAKTFDSIRVGMTAEQVRKAYEPLAPHEMSRQLERVDHQQLAATPNARFYLYYRGEHPWQHRIFFDEAETVVSKKRSLH